MAQVHVTRAALILTLAAGLLLAGCRAQQRGEAPIDVPPPQTQNLAEAQRVALEAQRAQKAGDPERAMQLYRESLSHSRELHPVWNNMGLLMMEEGNYMDAVEMFRTAADLAPHDPQPYYNLAVAYDRAGWSQDALRHYERALGRDPRHLASLRGYARSAKLLGVADSAALTHIRTGLLVDQDPQWREFFEREQYRVEQVMRDARSPRDGRPSARPASMP